MIPFDEDLAEEEEREHYLKRDRKNLFKRQSKEEALYGIFLSSSSDDSDKDFNKTQKQGLRHKGKSYGGIQFVSSGILNDETTESKNTSFSVRSPIITAKSHKNPKTTLTDDEVIRQIFPKDTDAVVVGYASSSTSSVSEAESDESDGIQHNNIHKHEHHAGLGAFSTGSDVSIGNKRRNARFLTPTCNVSSSPSSTSSNEMLEEDFSAEDKGANETNKDWRFHFVDMAHEKKEAEKKKKIHEGTKAAGTPLPESRMSRMYGKGFAMLKKMGYAGGGLGKEGTGMMNPLHVKIRQKHRGLQDTGEKAPDHEAQATSEERQLSAVDLLLGRRDKNTNDRKRWKRGTHKAPDTFHEKSAKSTLRKKGTNLQFKPPGQFEKLSATTKPEELSTNKVVITSNLEELLKDSKVLGRQEQKLRIQQLQAAGFVGTRESPLRIIDMTGSTQRIIEDKDELQSRLSEASIIAGKAPPSSTEDASMDVFLTERELTSDVSLPMPEMSHNLQVYIFQLQRRKAERERQRALEEERLKSFSHYETLARNKEMEARAQSAAIKSVLDCILTLRNSKHIKIIEQRLALHNKIASRGGSAEELRISSTDVGNRKAALLKYTSPASEESDNSTSQLSEKEDHASKVSEAVSIDEVLNELTCQFKDVVTKFPEVCLNLHVPRIASQFFLAVLCYADLTKYRDTTDIPFSEREDKLDPLYLASLIIQFKNDCLPQSSDDDDQELTQLRHQWQSVIEKQVTEGLKHVLLEMTVDPTNQDLQPMLTVFEWCSAVSTEIIAMLLDEQFFPRWQKVLEHWLTLPNLDLEEIYVWYSGWRSVFPDNLAANPIVQTGLMKGLQRINEHLEKIEGINTSENTPGGSNKPSSDLDEVVFKHRMPSSPPPPMPSQQNETSATTTTHVAAAASIQKRLSSGIARLTDVLEAVAENNNIVMIPKPGRTHNGKQVYSFGSVLIYLDSGVIYTLQSGGIWSCISPQALIDIAINKNISSSRQ